MPDPTIETETARPAPGHVQDAARAADAAGGLDVVLGNTIRGVVGMPARQCPSGRHRPDDDPTPGDRCKDCGQDLTWRGPGPYDWDTIDPVEVAAEAAGYAFLQLAATLTPLPGGHGYTCQRCDVVGVGIGHALVPHGTPDDRPQPVDGDPVYGEVAASLARGLAQAAAGQTVDLGDFTQYADDDDGTHDEDDESIPWRPRWPLQVSEHVKRELLRELAEVVHAPEPPPGDPRTAADWQTFRRGYETGMAKVMVHLGINEAASPERKTLPKPDESGR